MIGKLVTALAGRSLARRTGGRDAGMAGMVIGAGLPMMARRFGPMGMIAAAAGGYAVKKMMDKRRMQAPAAGVRRTDYPTRP
jgi:hypothetical protein